MEIFLSWIIFRFVVGFIGLGRGIGFLGAFILSLLISPIIGLIIALVSKNKEDEAYKQKVLTAQQNQQNALSKLTKTEDNTRISIADELEKLRKLRDTNSITEEEYLKLKERVINS